MVAIPTVAILGCGPAGLFCAQAMRLSGIEPIIFSKKVKSVIYGAQFLHQPIPGLSNPSPDSKIRTFRCGTAGGYAERVYGDAHKVTSWSKAQSLVDAWDLRSTYEEAWKQFESNIAHMDLSGSDIGELIASFDLVISTVPLWSICMLPRLHRFDSVPILVKKSIGNDPSFSTLATALTDQGGDNWIIYNGMPLETSGHWYRGSHIFGHWSLEARASQELVKQKSWDAGFKVVDNTCDCHPGLIRAGRMGQWRAGVLTHHAFQTAIEAVTDQFGSAHPSS